MNTVLEAFHLSPVAQSVLALSLVISLGLALGNVRFSGIKLGVAGVLFSGLFLGYFKLQVHPEISEFIREFGLMLFVYTVGIEVGPAFFSSLKNEGLKLNLLAAAVVFGGALLAYFFYLFGQIQLPVSLGLFSGASTNTPSLAAAQQALKELPNYSPEIAKLPAIGYAIAYPFGIVGIILTMVVTKSLFKIDLGAEAERHSLEQMKKHRKPEMRDLKVENPNLEGCSVDKLPVPDDVVVSRILHRSQLKVALPAMHVHVGDTLRVVGPPAKLDLFQKAIGSEAAMDFRGLGSAKIFNKRVIVTQPEWVGKSLEEMAPHEDGVRVTRVIRGELEFPASRQMDCQYADTLLVVGEEDAIKRFSKKMGNSVKELNHPRLIPVFTGLLLGILAGSFPIQIPAMPVPVKLGLAGGPLIIAMLLSRIGKIGPLFWYMPASANHMLREIGITLFLSCVGLRAGDVFFKTLLSPSGVYFLFAGMLITFLPLMAAAVVARKRFQMNYLSICGLLAGSMTDPPALAYANQMVPSSAQVLAYASVYPLVMILRVVLIQVLTFLPF